MTASPGRGRRRVGSGEPMLLVHGIGHRRQLWEPIIDRLADRFDMIAVDLPGFGESPPLAAGDEPTPSRLADELEAVLDDAGWPTAHLVGNSLGGWLVLELARRGRARSVTALMPAGLWLPGHGSESVRHRVVFALWRALARMPGAAHAVRLRVVRTIALAGAFGRPRNVPPDVAAGDARNLRDCDLSRTMKATAGRRFTGGQAITVPVTVALGTRDPLIRRRDLDLTQVPGDTHVTTLRAAGHVPTWDDPDAVAAVVAATTVRTSTGPTRASHGANTRSSSVL